MFKRRLIMKKNIVTNYDGAVKTIKEAILRSQLDSIKAVNEKQLQLYFIIGAYISSNSRKGFWGEDALKIISEKLDKEMPGLRGYSERNLRLMRTFYEEWSFLMADPSSSTTKPIIWNSRIPNCESLSLEAFLAISFTHHRAILTKVKSLNERIFYINLCANCRLSYRALSRVIDEDLYHRQGNMPSNFELSIKNADDAFKAIKTFKDNYILDFINVEELDVRDKEDIDERVLEKGIINNIKKFILTFGKGFSFIRNQYHLDAFGVDQYIDLLFFNRDLNCLVAVELKTGKFKTAYLGQLSGYLSILDGFERRPHENPSIGIILCKDMDKSFVDYVISDYRKPMGVATYKTSKDMSDELKKALPDLDELRRLIDIDEND